jgi:hypothetical protein
MLGLYAVLQAVVSLVGHSCLNATIGSTRAARRAGSQAAIRANDTSADDAIVVNRGSTATD